jgi:hypothetical protein
MPIEDDRESDEKEKVERSVRQRLEGLVPDLVKRTLAAGIGAVFTTEEGIRKLTQEFSLPKDVAAYLISGAQSTKDELFKVVAREVSKFLEGLNVTNEIAKILTTLSLEIKTEIRFIPNDEALGGVKPDIKKQVALKINREEKS